MQKLLEILFVFLFCATAGWVIEVIYRSSKKHRLINPGFLVGCCLPIYGSGGLALYLISGLSLDFIPVPALRIVFLLIVAMIIMTTIEFIAGYLSLKYYHTRLWDYSMRWMNYKGIICPLFTFYWGVLSAAFYFLVYPWLKTLASDASNLQWCVLLIGTYYGVFLVDLSASLDLLQKIRAYAKTIRETVDFDQLQLKAKMQAAKHFRKPQFVYMFRMHDALGKYLNEAKAAIGREVEKDREKFGKLGAEWKGKK